MDIEVKAVLAHFSVGVPNGGTGEVIVIGVRRLMIEMLNEFNRTIKMVYLETGIWQIPGLFNSIVAPGVWGLGGQETEFLYGGVSRFIDMESS